MYVKKHNVKEDSKVWQHTATIQCYFPRFAAAAVAAAIAADVAAPVGLLPGLPVPPVAALLPAAPRLVVPVSVLFGCNAADEAMPSPPGFGVATAGSLADEAGEDAVCGLKGPDDEEEGCEGWLEDACCCC